MGGPGTLAPHRLVGVDSSIFIYAFEHHPEFGTRSAVLLSAIQAGTYRAIASLLVLGELLVRPFRDGHPALARGYSERLTAFRNLQLVAADQTICETAAEFRAAWPVLRLPDAVHLATAIRHGATAFISGDRRLPQIPGLEILRP